MGIGRSFYCEKCDQSYHVSDGVGFLFPMTSRAVSLLSQPVVGNIDGYVRKNGQLIRYDKEKNEYASGLPGRKINTIHKLNDEKTVLVDGEEKTLKGEEYFKYMKGKEAYVDEQV